MRREVINKAFNIKINNLAEDNWIIDASEKENLKIVLSDVYFNNVELLELFSNLTDLRNDVNHSGMRSKRLPFSPQSLIKNIEKCLVGTERILIQAEVNKPTTESRKLINLSNHPSTFWDENQLKAAAEYGEIVDLSFPAVDADADETYIEMLVDDYFETIKEMTKGNIFTVHLMGEMTFTLALVKKLQQIGIDCIASTSERISTEMESGQKQVIFNFVRFRKYNL